MSGQASPGPGAAARHLPVMESVAVVILAIASLASAWCGYQAGRWNGEQARAYEHSSQLRVEAARADAIDEEARTVDLVIYSNYLNAGADGDTALAERYRSRFQPRFAEAYDAWSAQPEATRPETPFLMPVYQDTDNAARAAEVRARSDASFQRALDAATHSDEFTLVTVALAGVLFLAGIVSTLRYAPARVAALAIAAIGLIAALVRMFTLPAA